MSHDYVFQFDYFNRGAVKEFLNLVNSKFPNPDILTTVGVFVNNLPPDQIAYVLLSFENPPQHVGEWVSSLGIPQVFDKDLGTLLKESLSLRKYNHIAGAVTADQIDFLYRLR